jgi:hypothetical protein
VNELPQVQVTWVSTYSGWMSRFMESSRGPLGRSASRTVNQNRDQWCQMAL